MRTTMWRTMAVAGVVAMVLAGCSSDDGDEETEEETPASVTAERPATSDEDDAEADADDSDADDGDAAADADDGDASDADGESANADLEADQEVVDPTWSQNPQEFRGEIGVRVAYECSPGGDESPVWGTETYTDDSSVCTAGVHAGLITYDDGGRLVIEIVEGEASYEGSEANGVTSADWGEWPGAFIFPDA